jgi:hypothetical protein
MEKSLDIKMKEMALAEEELKRIESSKMIEYRKST